MGRRRIAARKCGSAMLRERWKRAVGCRELLVSEGRKDVAPSKETKKERERGEETSREGRR